MKIKTPHILEAVIVMFILGLLFYTMIPMALQSQKYADVVKLEKAMEAIQTILEENPNDLTFFIKNKGNTHDGWSGPWYNRVKNELLLLYYKENGYELIKDNLEHYDNRIDVPDWTHSNLYIYGYTMHAKKSPYHSGWSGFQEQPTYASVVARVGLDDKKRLHVEPYTVRINDNGNFDFKTYMTPFNPSNGMDSYGEFLIDTNDIWPATTAVLMATPINPKIKFTGFSWDTTTIIRGQ